MKLGLRSSGSPDALILGLGFLVLLLGAAGTTALILTHGRVGPWPSAAHVMAHGLAAWPADTRAEAEAECSDLEAREWRLDAAATIQRFAEKVLRYPDPTFEVTGGANPHRRSALVNTRGVKRLFLGSRIDVQRLGRCWYVVNAIPREGYFDLNVAFQIENEKALVIAYSDGGFPHTEIGWGGWQRTIDGKLQEKSQIELVPPPSAHGEPGHYILTFPDSKGISEMVQVSPLGALPSAGKKPLARHDLANRVGNKRLCDLFLSNRRGPQRIISQLINSEFARGSPSNVAFPGPSFVNKTRLGSAHWRLEADEAELDLRFSKVGERCWVLDSMRPTSGSFLRDVRAGERSFTRWRPRIQDRRYTPTTRMRPGRIPRLLGEPGKRPCHIGHHW